MSKRYSKEYSTATCGQPLPGLMLQWLAALGISREKEQHSWLRQPKAPL